jgi:methionyl-tRNA formyltransferase
VTVLDRIGMLAVDSSRARAYVDAMAKASLLPEHAILIDSPTGARGKTPPVPYFDNETPVAERLRELGVPVREVAEESVNAPAVVEAVSEAPGEVLVYAGPGGQILRAELLDAGKRFLHVHSGLLPDFRGSTTIYYSLLERGDCGASALFLEASIDAGPVVATATYPAPEDRTTIDHGYDPFIRADLLLRVLGEYAVSGAFPEHRQPADRGETYYVMHPVLRHIAILGEARGAGA